MTDDEREALAERAEKIGKILPRLRQSGHFTMTVIAAQLRADGERIKALEAALRGLLACPAIADGSHAEPAWGCPETAAAETAARELLKEPGNA